MEKDCPECEYCCLIGLCCPLEAQRKALVAAFVREVGASPEEAQKYADVLVRAKVRMEKS